MKRTTTELRKIFNRKIGAIESLLALVSQQGLRSEERKESLSQVAVLLRSLFCYSGGEALIVRTQFDKTMLFPLHDCMSPFIELSQFLLVGCGAANGTSTFSSTIDLTNKVAAAWLSYHSWINEIVIDIKTDGFPPLTRFEVIKIIADREGAHVDPDVHPFVELIESTNVMPLKFIIGGKECEGDCSNLLYETICSIAKETVYSYKYARTPITWPLKSDSDFILGIFDFSDSKRARYKYTICSPKVSLFNTNQYYPCVMSSFSIAEKELLFGSKKFPIRILSFASS